MSWISVLYETYDRLSESEDITDLLPIAHTTQKAQIEVTINAQSDFVSAKVIEKDDAETVIPCTEESGGRSGSAPIHHPLMDKLQYVAGDYGKFGGMKGEQFHIKYMGDLRKWCNSEYPNQKVCILRDYLEKGRLIEDLKNAGVLHCDENDLLLEKWASKDVTPAIYKAVQGNQSDAFVRFLVIGVDDVTALWEDKVLQQDYVQYYTSIRQTDGRCYVTGKTASCTVNHPNKIRDTGDKAKLISANDESGYTYRGRFNGFQEAAQVSYEVSQKAHSALKWLIKHQGRRYGSRVFVAWNPENRQCIDVMEDSLDMLLDAEGGNSEVYESGTEFAKRFVDALSGYKCDLQHGGTVAIIGVDAATTGRMAMTFYREVLQNELVDRVLHWHEGCRWKHAYRFNQDKKLVIFEGAPSPKDIALAAFGVERNFLEIDDKLCAQVVERLLPCIIDGAALPYDIMQGAYRNVCHPQNYKNTNNWKKVLGICCSLVRKYRFDQYKEVWTVEVQREKQDMEYLCGRLLAVADALEQHVLNKKGENRETAAMRYFTRFQERPGTTWGVIMKALPPYINALERPLKVYYEKMLGEISVMIPSEEFVKARNLDGRMALGFFAQKNEIYTAKPKTDKVDDMDETQEV